jgi:hypothetical protein
MPDGYRYKNCQMALFKRFLNLKSGGGVATPPPNLNPLEVPNKARRLGGVASFWQSSGSSVPFGSLPTPVVSAPSVPSSILRVEIQTKVGFLDK